MTIKKIKTINPSSKMKWINGNSCLDIEIYSHMDETTYSVEVTRNYEGHKYHVAVFNYDNEHELSIGFNTVMNLYEFFIKIQSEGI